MEKKPIEEGVYHKLGGKAFWLFFFQNAIASFALLFMAIILIVLRFMDLSNTPFGDIQSAITSAASIVFLFFIVSLLVAYLIAWLLYSHFQFMLDHDSLQISHGILFKTQDSIPYRQIQNINIEQDIIFQMLGVSRLVVLTAGHEEGKNTKGVIPAIDSDAAIFLKDMLLQKSDVQKTENIEDNIEKNANI